MTKGFAISLLFAAIALTVFAQLAFRAQVGLMPPLPADWIGRFLFIAKVLSSPLVIVALAASFVVAGCWTLAITTLPLSVAYPMLSLTFPLVVFGAHFFFGEPVGWLKIAGLVVIICGILLMHMDK